MNYFKKLFKKRLNGKFSTKAFYYILTLLFSVSFSTLSLLLIPININTNYKFEYIFTFIIVFIIGFIFSEKLICKVFIYIKKDILLSLFALFFSSIIITKLYITKGLFVYNIIPSNIINIFKIKYFIISFFSETIFVIYFVNIFKEKIINIYLESTKWDKKAFIISSIICFLIIVIMYSIKSGWFMQYDKVFSIDSGWCFSSIIPNANYYDIRHPFLSIFYFPIWAVIDSFVTFIFGKVEATILVQAIIIQLINAELLILCGLYLKKITNNKNVFILYMLSFPTLTYTLFLEKYQLTTFLLIIYVAMLCLNKKRIIHFINAAGVMPTSIVIGIGEFVKKDKFENKFINLNKMIIGAALFTISIGRLHIFEYGLLEIFNEVHSYTIIKLSFIERLYSTINMIKSTIISLSIGNIGGKLMWNNLTTNLSIIGLIIIAISIIGFIVHKKELISKISIIWIIFSFILFIILNWCPNESPLFNLYFSWATIILFVYGLDWLISKIKFNKTITYALLYIIISFINISALIKVFQFL